MLFITRLLDLSDVQDVRALRRALGRVEDGTLSTMHSRCVEEIGQDEAARVALQWVCNEQRARKARTQRGVLPFDD